jgi:hypothetical protein
MSPLFIKISPLLESAIHVGGGILILVELSHTAVQEYLHWFYANFEHELGLAPLDQISLSLRNPVLGQPL